MPSFLSISAGPLLLKDRLTGLPGAEEQLPSFLNLQIRSALQPCAGSWRPTLLQGKYLPDHGGYARGNLDYNLYGLGSGGSQFQLPLKQTGPVVFAEFLRRIAWKVFLTKLTEIESKTWPC